MNQSNKEYIELLVQSGVHTLLKETPNNLLNSEDLDSNINDKLVKKSGEKCDISEVSQSFLAWTRQSNNKSKTVSKHIFETNMNRILGKHKNKK